MLVASYGDQQTSSGEPGILKDLEDSITGRHVLIVEDIIDTGNTLQQVLRLLAKRQPASLHVCTLLDKPSRRQVAVDVRYVGFEIEDLFVVGYGMDDAQLYRHLPYIGVKR
jgi:hypoxanthine phosphoribosyltransferase